MKFKFKIVGIGRALGELKAKRDEFKQELRGELKIFAEDFYEDLKGSMGSVPAFSDYTFSKGSKPVKWAAKSTLRYNAAGEFAKTQTAPNFWWWTGHLAHCLRKRKESETVNDITWFVGFDPSLMRTKQPGRRQGPTAWQKFIWNEYGWTVTSEDGTRLLKRPLYRPLEKKYREAWDKVAQELATDYAMKLGKITYTSMPMAKASKTKWTYPRG